MRWRTERIFDFATYIGIAITFSAGLVWFASASGPNGADQFGRWGGLVINTAILFGYIIKESRPHWHIGSFWMLTIVMFSAHVVVFTAILLHIQEWKVLWFLVMYPIEIPLFGLLLDRIIATRPRKGGM